MHTFAGTGVALITPFKNDNSIDVEKLKDLVEYQIENRVAYLVVLGTTAESGSLDPEEKELVKNTVITQNNKRLPLVLGVGGNNTAKVVEEIKKVNPNTFSAVLSVSPYYNKPTQEGIFQHFKEVAAASPVPVLLYNVPGRTSSNMLPETVAQIAEECPNVIGIKEAAGDLVQAMKMIALLPKDFLVISGDDMLALPICLAGGKGVISVIAQGFPEEFSEMLRFGLEGKVKEAYALHYKIAPSIELIFTEGNPAGIKALLAKKGLCSNNLRLPLVKASEKLQGKIERFVEQF